MPLVAGLMLVAMPIVASEPVESSKEFEVEIPVGIDSARSVFLVLSDVQLPKMAAVVLRARLVESSKGGETEVPLGSLGLLADSKDAEGIAEHDVIRIEVSKKLKRWRAEHPDVKTLRVRVIPFAGANPLPTL